jgi:hypothetical protein
LAIDLIHRNFVEVTRKVVKVLKVRGIIVSGGRRGPV